MKDNTIFWARLLGLYAVIVSLWCFWTERTLGNLLRDLAGDPVMLMNFGVYTLLLGLSIVVSHSSLKGWPMFVTILGYYVTLKGIVLLFFPAWVGSMATFWEGQHMMLAGLPAFTIGCILLWIGFVRK